MSVLLEVTKTWDTSRAFQPKPKWGEGSEKEKRLFRVVLLCFASEFGLTHSFLGIKMKLKLDGQICFASLSSPPSPGVFLFELPKFSHSEHFSLGCRKEPLMIPKGPGCADGSLKGFEGFPGGRAEALSAPFTHGLVEVLSLCCIFHLWH